MRIPMAGAVLLFGMWGCADSQPAATTPPGDAAPVASPAVSAATTMLVLNVPDMH